MSTYFASTCSVFETCEMCFQGPLNLRCLWNSCTLCQKLNKRTVKATNSTTLSKSDKSEHMQCLQSKSAESSENKLEFVKVRRVSHFVICGKDLNPGQSFKKEHIQCFCTLGFTAYARICQIYSDWVDAESWQRTTLSSANLIYAKGSLKKI